jgi:GDPmannose 4,6-dehydratase
MGNLDAKRDWGHARDYVEAQWLMLQQDTPADLVIATGEQHSVREFVDNAARVVGLDIHWQGTGVHERGVADGRVVVAVDPGYFRPTEVDSLVGDASRARAKLGWTPKVRFPELVREMMESDLEAAEREIYLEKRPVAHGS